jgi:hypothetical protein
VTCVVIGDTGAGKSEFGNRYLGDSLFEANDSPLPVTLEPQVKSSVVDGVTRQVIDTEGHADGNSVSSKQIQTLARFFRNWKQGVNGICVILNGQHDRFSQGIKDTLRFSYNTFATCEVLKHICVVFTRCYDAVRNPNRKRKETEYRRFVQEFLQEISGVDTVPTVPVFFVDSLDPESEETERNMVQFHGWLTGLSPLSTSDVKEVALRDKIEDEFANAVFANYRYEGPPEDQKRFAIFEDRRRQKIKPYNGDPPRYGEWIVTQTWEEPAGTQSVKIHEIEHEVEEKRVDHHCAHSWGGFSSHDHTHFQIVRKTWTEQWKETISFDGKVTTTKPVRVGGFSERVIRSDRKRGFSSAYRMVDKYMRQRRMVAARV